VTIKQDKITRNEKGTNDEVSFVEIILNSWHFIIVTTRSQPHGTCWSKFYRVQVMSYVVL